MNHRHRKTLHALFAHPLSANIDFREAVSVLEELGAVVENKSGNRIGVSLNGHNHAFHNANHTMPTEEVAEMRKFLETCGVTPADFPV